MEGASRGRAAVLGGRGLTCLLLPAVAAPQPAGAVLVLGGAVRSRAECWLGSLASSAQSRMLACDTPYLSSSEMQCSGHPDGFVTLPMGLCAHKPIKGLHRYNVESILCLLSNAGIIQLVTG